MKRKSKGSQEKAQALATLLDSNPTEEEIHQFFKDEIFGIGHVDPYFSERFIIGAIPKFPVTPDRVPDFTLVRLNVVSSQTPGRVTFLELKKPDSLLYTSHSRMSKDLNDAWMECIETSRLMADGFRDCLRRLVKTLDKQRLKQFVRTYDRLKKQGKEERGIRDFLLDNFMPWCTSAIVIGRRSTLDAEGLLRTKELSASTSQTITVMTYDTVLDWVAEADEDDYYQPWNPFMGGWC
jgi:hypothetical protein